MTEEVNIYNIKPINDLPPIKIIDTPGFGDTRGIEQDKEITRKIAEVFRNKITRINAICFVAKSANARLTQSQSYIFSSILNLFGKDVAENFVFLLTFYDGHQPEVLASLEKGDTISEEIIPKVKEKYKNWYYTFNNKSIFNSERTEMDKIFYESSMKNFKDFCEHLKNIPSKSLIQSKEVIQHRKELEDSISSLGESLNHCLSKMGELNSIKKIINGLKGNLNEYGNFKIKQKVSKPVVVADNSTNILCQDCKHTCHKDCWTISNMFKWTCHIFNGDKCTVCPGQCGKDSHVRVTDYYYEYQTKEVEVEVEELKEKYFKAEKGLNEKEEILKGLEEDYQKEKDICLQIQERITDHVNRLIKIALNGASSENSEDYIRLAIKEEQRKKKPGYEDRIDSLKQLLQAYKLLKVTYKKDNKGKLFEDKGESFKELLEGYNKSDCPEEVNKIL